MAVIIYKCPNCGGDLRFDPATQKYRCEYCVSLFSQEELEAIETAGTGPESAGEEEPEEPAVVYHCPSCGAEIVTDASTSATFCYYCHNPVVLSEKLAGAFHPDYVLPFAIDRKKALEIFRQWIGKKRYVPKDFYSEEQIEKLTGVYFPYWLFSCQVEGGLEAEGIRNKIWTTGNMQYTQVEKYQVKRDGQMEIRNVTRNALSKANRQLVEGVLPFEMKEMKPFHMGYLSGFMAENRDMDQVRFEPEVETEVKEFAENSLKSQISGYDSLNVSRQVTDLEQKKWNYALLPVWTLTYRDPGHDKIYYFACNGQTGKICGELPLDQGRLMRLFAAVFFPIFLALLIVGYMI